MNPIQKFCYKAFCINFCGSSACRRAFLLLHLGIIVATFTIVHWNQLFYRPMSISQNHALAIIVWFLSYIFEYVVILLEGFLKDSEFNEKYKSTIRALCERDTRYKRDHYKWIIFCLLFFDIVYIVITHPFQVACFSPKITCRLRLWSYLHLCRSVLMEFEALIENIDQTVAEVTEEEFLKLQCRYLDLWMVSQLIGDYYVWSLCCILLHIVVDNILYIFWFFTVDFNEPQIFVCK